ncbi:MAG: cytochrome c biogenesis CcdA family protein [Acidimicrobiales bacterium]
MGGRRAIALVLVVATLAVAVVGAILASGTGWLNILVDRVAGASGGFVGELFPLGFAFSAGMASAFNPCDFPLLPTYLGLFLADQGPDAHARPATRLTRALAVGGAVTVGFVLLFTALGVTIGVGAHVLVAWLPWIALCLGVALVFAGGYRLAGGSIYSALPERLGARVGAGERGVRGYALFGLAYGLASLSCTLPIFLAVVGASITTSTVWSSLGALVLYGLGMGSVIVTLTIAAGLFKAALGVHMRRIVRSVDAVGTIALFAAGGYIVYYWLTIGGLLSDLT